MDGSGNLFIADNCNNRIRKIVLATGIISTVAGTGVSGYSGDGGLAINAELLYPQDITIGVGGDLLFVDTGNRVIRRINSSSGIITTIAGNGGGGDTGDNGIATDATFNFPRSITVDASNNLFIGDYYKIRKVDNATGIITTFAGTGTGGFNGDTGSPTNLQIYLPWGLAFDGNGNLFVAEHNNNRIRKITNPISQSITFEALPIKSFGDALFELIATTSSGLPISYSSSNPEVATISGSTVTIVGVGSTVFTASQVGDANYLAAPNVQQTLIVNKANQTINFSALPTRTYGVEPFQLEANTSSGLSIFYTSSDPTVASITGSTVTILKPGTVDIIASQLGNDNYNAAQNVTQTLTVDKGNQTISFPELVTKSIGDAAFNLTATSTSGLSVSFASSNSEVATITGSTVTIVGAGTTTITASQSGDANYNAALDVTRTLTVNKIDQTITFGTLVAKNFGDPHFTLSATTTSDLTITYASSNTSVATISGSTVTIVGAGTTTITASQAGDATYNVATDVMQTLTVNKINQTITFLAITDKTVGDATFSLSATSTSSLPITFTTTSNKITITGSQVTIGSAGRATITAAQAGNDNYNAATSVEVSFCIKPIKPTISVSNANTAAPTLTSSASVGNQWYRNGIAIAGATNATYNATQAGVYKVQAKIDDCVSEYSNDQALVVTGDVENYLDNSISVYPNPTRDILNITLGNKNERKEITLLDITGRKIESRQVWEDEASFDVSVYIKGFYIVRVKKGSSEKVLRFVKE